MKILFHRFLIIISFVLAITIFTDVANACSCISNQTVDKEFAESLNVAVLKLQSVEENEKVENYFLTVEKVFKGDLRVGETLPFKPGVFCSWTFDKANVGVEYLFYLGERPGIGEVWVGGYCSRSGRATSRVTDLLYLENEKKMRGRTRLSGTLDKMIETPEDDERYSFHSLANRKIRITGKGKKIELVTDENGVYETYDLPPGTYKITPEKVEGYTFTSGKAEFAEVKIKAKSHTERNFYFEIDNSVSGKIFDAFGKPLENVCLDLIPSRNERAINYSKGSCTNDKGEFEVSGIPEGTYILVINKDGKITLYNPFVTFYYPNVKDKEKAMEITVGASYFLRDLRIIPPEIVETIILNGTLLFADGRPVANEIVQFLKGEEIPKSFNGYLSSNFKVKTDKNGRFTIKTLKGQNGVLRGSMYSYVGEYKNCPKIDKEIRQKGDSVQRIDTVDIDIDAAKSLSGIELIFPFPSCKKK